MKTIFGFWSLFLTCFLFIIPQAQASNSSSIPIDTTLLLHPSHLHGHQIANKFLSQKDLINVIKWSPPKGGVTPVSYKIYRDSSLTDLLAVIPANHKLTFRDHNRKENHKYSYFIVSVDASGNQSSAIGIIFKGSKTHLVKVKRLVSIEVTPTDPTIAKDFEIQFTATGIFSDNTKKDLTTQVTWSSSDPSIATISNTPPTQGLATGISAGTTVITATLGGTSGSTSHHASSSTSCSSSGSGSCDSESCDSDSGSCSSSGSSCSSSGSSCSSSGSESCSSSESISSSSSSSSSSGISGSTTLTVTSATLVSIQVSPTDPVIAAGFDQQFTAIGVFSDNTNEDLTDQVVWSSSDPIIATISNTSGSQGLAHGLVKGNVQITATHGAISGSTTLTVTNATLLEISVTPTTSTIAAGFTQQFIATGLFSDNTIEDITREVIWSSSNVATATISNTSGTQGLATGISEGTVQITATHGAVSGSATLTVTAAVLVSIQIEPILPDSFLLPLGRQQQFAAIGTFSDNTTEDLTTEVTWTSSDEGIVAVSSAEGSEGLATATGIGTATITAASGNVGGNKKIEVTAAVLDSIQVTPINPTIAKGLTQQFTATGTYSDTTTKNLTTQVTWQSSAPGIATIVPNTGLAKCEMVGATTITASLAGVSGTTILTVSAAMLTEIQVTPTNASFPIGRKPQYTAIGIFTDGSNLDITDQVEWTSSAETIATISNADGSQGLATAKAVGETLITATQIGGTLSDSTNMFVTAVVLDEIQVSPPNPSEAAGVPVEFAATGIYSDMSTQPLTEEATWESSSDIAEVSNTPPKGVAVGSTGGTVTISATFMEVTGSTEFTITPATLVSITVSPNPKTVAKGTPVQFTATGTYTDGTQPVITQMVTWSSSDPAVAQISNASNKGEASTIGVGTTTITAKLEGFEGTASLTVTAATLVSIAVTPNTATIPKGTEQQFMATGTYTDSTTQNITKIVTWTTSDPATVSISNVLTPEEDTKGIAKGENIGSGITIFAEFPQSPTPVIGTATINVTSAVLVSIAVTPANATIFVGDVPTDYTATGTYSDSTTMDITKLVTWESDKTTIAFVDNADGRQGKVSGQSVGSATITATDPATEISGSTSVTVASCPGITITSSTLPTAFIFTPYSAQILTSGGEPPIIFVLVSGELPDGLTLSTSGLISGTPDSVGPGIVRFTVRATTRCGSSTQKELQFQYKSVP